MEIAVVNKTNEKVGSLAVPEEVFGVKWNADLVHQVVTSLETNKRAPIAHTKSRSEVSGGGKKPWRQKGTGRARHGSTRSPIWVGGGVAFGPTKEINFKRKVNKKMKTKALYCVLSQKLRDNEIMVIDDFGVEKPSAKSVAEILKHVRGRQKNVPRTLLVAKQGDKNMVLSGRNIMKNEVVYSGALNIGACLQAKRVVFEKEAMEEFIQKQTPANQ